jgi:CPA2 family monovalent cation:H+ antiporter-2
MTADPIFFRDLAYVLTAAVLGGGVAWLTRQPLILGYVVGGILISPLTPGPSVSDIHTFETFAEIGVILLMFSIGIEFSLRDLVRVRWVALLGGPLGIVLSVAVGLGVGTLLGWRALEGMVVGIVVSVASTMVLARLLVDRGELGSPHGRIMIGITLVEDLAVVVLIVLIPVLGALEPRRLLAIGQALGTGLAILIPLFYLARKVIPALLTRVARTQSDELFLLVTLALGIGTAAVTHAVGLSLALGAFLAGLLISESDYAHESLSRLLPLRDTFVALFFVTIGALVNPAAIAANLPLLGVLLGLIVVGKLVIWTVVVLMFGYSVRTALLVAAGLTQIGEFSFILIQVARSAGHVGEDLYNGTLAASLLSILVNAVLVRYAPRWVARLGREGRGLEAAAGGPAYPAAHVVLCGFGRVGSAVGEALEAFRAPYVVIEADPEIAKNLRARGVPCVFGDASRRRILETAGAGRAALAVVAVPEFEPAQRAVRALRELSPGMPILARAHHSAGRDRLVAAGATEVIQPEVEGAFTLIRHALRGLDIPRARVLAYLERFRGALETSTEAGAAAEMLPGTEEFVVAGDRLAGQSLRGARIRERFGVTVLAITRSDGTTVMHPSPESVLRSGDRVRVFGRREQIAAFLREAGDQPEPQSTAG